MNSLTEETFDKWCETLRDDSPSTRFESFSAFRKFAAACLLYHNVNITDGKPRWSDDGNKFTVCDGVILTLKP